MYNDIHIETHVYNYMRCNLFAFEMVSLLLSLNAALERRRRALHRN